MSGESVLSIEGLCFAYGRRTIFEKTCLRVDRGEIVRVDGTNGSGKSTLLNLIMGSTAMQSGRVKLGGTDITHMSVPGRARLGIRRVRQFERLFKEETITGNVSGALLSSSQNDPWIPAQTPTEVVERLAESNAGELSYGWRKVVQLLQAIGPRPRLLLLDEPFAGLAESIRTWMFATIDEYVFDQDASVLVVDHERDGRLRVDSVMKIKG